MSTNANSWNESLINDWVATQRKYWDTWSDFAKEKIMITQEELRNEKSLVLDLLP